MIAAVPWSEIVVDDKPPHREAGWRGLPKERTSRLGKDRTKFESRIAEWRLSRFKFQVRRRRGKNTNAGRGGGSVWSTVGFDSMEAAIDAAVTMVGEYDQVFVIDGQLWNGRRDHKAEGLLWDQRDEEGEA